MLCMEGCLLVFHLGIRGAACPLFPRKLNSLHFVQGRALDGPMSLLSAHKTEIIVSLMCEFLGLQVAIWSNMSVIQPCGMGLALKQWIWVIGA